jgi:YHS domain-containing protein
MKHIPGQSRWSLRKRKLGVRMLDRDNAEILDDHHLLCCWDVCEKHAVSLYWARENHSTRFHEEYVWYYFCSERCKQYWLNSPTDLYNLPPGLRSVL